MFIDSEAADVLTPPTAIQLRQELYVSIGGSCNEVSSLQLTTFRS